MQNLSSVLSRSLVSDCLACPICGHPLLFSPDAKSLLCAGPRVHCYDGASGGYVPLAPRHVGGGDSKEAVRARSGFLHNGYYEQAADALCRVVCTHTQKNGAVLDAGCGEGYYSNRIAAQGYRVLGVDLSKYAVDTAAKAARQLRSGGTDFAETVYAVGSIFELPVQSGCMDTVVNVFAPCAPDEFARVLKPNGILIVAGAGQTHLLGLKKVVYDDPYLNDPRRDLPTDADAFTLVDMQTVTYDTVITGRENIDALFSMTPYYWRTSREGKERLSVTESLETPISFEFHIYRKK